ncbi:hypothetical protein BDZ94DRAFT_1303926, partial [Collybia nuda]
PAALSTVGISTGLPTGSNLVATPAIIPVPVPPQRRGTPAAQSTVGLSTGLASGSNLVATSTTVSNTVARLGSNIAPGSTTAAGLNIATGSNTATMFNLHSNSNNNWPNLGLGDYICNLRNMPPPPQQAHPIPSIPQVQLPVGWDRPLQNPMPQSIPSAPEPIRRRRTVYRPVHDISSGQADPSLHNVHRGHIAHREQRTTHEVQRAAYLLNQFQEQQQHQSHVNQQQQLQQLQQQQTQILADQLEQQQRQQARTAEQLEQLTREYAQQADNIQQRLRQEQQNFQERNAAMRRDILHEWNQEHEAELNQNDIENDPTVHHNQPAQPANNPPAPPVPQHDEFDDLNDIDDIYADLPFPLPAQPANPVTMPAWATVT